MYCMAIYSLLPAEKDFNDDRMQIAYIVLQVLQKKKKKKKHDYLQLFSIKVNEQ